MKPWLFIFDFDGVIANTSQALYNIYETIVCNHGGHPSKKEFGYLNGPNLNEIAAYLCHKHKFDCTTESLKLEFNQQFSQLHRTTQPTEHIRDLLLELHAKDVTLTVATSSNREYIDAHLDSFALGNLFDLVICGDDVAKAKPSPDIYLKVIEKYPKHQAFVIEDSDNGIIAAQQASLPVIFYNPEKRSHNNHASYEINSHLEIHSLFKELQSTAILSSYIEEIECVISNDTLDFPPEFKEQAHQIWQKACASNKQLFNGNVTCYSHHTSNKGHLKLSLHKVEYQYVYPSIQGKLRNGPAPVGVNGLVINQSGKALLGKRSNNVSEYKEHWELAPAGGLAEEFALDCLAQIKDELYEETGITNSNILSSRVFCLIFDQFNQVYDLGILIKVNQKEQSNYNFKGEYSELQWCEIGQLDCFFRSHMITPTSKAIYEAYRKSTYL
ncbi:MAG: HAD-IA family hydrolase [Planctomycetes bacterium]|nr:HAD-IA family hydrolase [Planctomycetota bacterium]